MTTNEQLPMDPELAAVLDQIREQHHLHTREQAAEMLVKRRLARSARQIAMRGRALYLLRGRQ